jgi:hypothetical protein
MSRVSPWQTRDTAKHIVKHGGVHPLPRGERPRTKISSIHPILNLNIEYWRSGKRLEVPGGQRRTAPSLPDP